MHQRNYFLLFIALLIGVLFSGCATHNAAMDFHADGRQFQQTGPEYPKSIVVYDSWSGNTGKIADEIARILNCPSIHMDDIRDYFPNQYDLIVVGSPVHGGRPTDKIEKFLSELENINASAVFVTYGAPFFGTFTANRCLDFMEKELHQTSLGRFKCNGFHKIFRTYPSHPDETDLTEAARFAEGLLARLKASEGGVSP
jgi:flavodoxin